MKNMILKIIVLSIILITNKSYCGVVVEGAATGIEKINTINYNPDNNSFSINNKNIFNSPVNTDEMIEIIDAVNLDERVGVSVTLNDELIVYGKLHKRSETAEKLEDADNFIRSIVFAEYSRLRKYSLPYNYKPVIVKNRTLSSVIYLQLSNFTFINKNGQYLPNSLQAEVMLIPMATYTAPDGGYLPDYDALEKGIFQKEDKANADHINKYKSEYLKLPPLKEAIKIGQATSFIRYLRNNGINLNELSRSLIEGENLTLIGENNQFAKSETKKEIIKEKAEIIAEAELDKLKINPIENNIIKNSRNNYAENIRQIFLIDTIVGNTGKIKLSRDSVNDGTYVKYRENYLKSIKDPVTINLEKTPKDFKIAFEKHIKAWEKALSWLKDKQIAEGEESFTAFYNEHNKYRNELQQTYNICKEIAKKYQNIN